MITDPLFILGFIGMAACLYAWISFNINNTQVEPFILKYISSISLISGLAMLMSIFINSGDLGIILLFGSVISFLIMILGYYLNNSEIAKTSRGYLIPILMIFILRTFLYEPYQIPSGSMEPQLEKGDFLLVNKFAYGLKVNRVGTPKFLRSDPQYGDAVVIIPPHNNVPYIKRLIGKPGDIIEIINKKVYINGRVLERNFLESEEIFLQQKTNVKADIFYEKHGLAEYSIRNIRGVNIQIPKKWVVPEDHYFVMGDNRDNSNDSTKWTLSYVPRENFFGRADYLWMTWECWTCLPSFEKVGPIN